MAINQALYMERQAVSYPIEEAPVVAASENKLFQASYSPFAASGGDTLVYPYGMETGGVISPTTNNDEVSCSSSTAVIADDTNASASGRVSIPAAASLATPRPTASNKIIHAIVVARDAGVYSVVSGTEGSDFSDVLGAAGGPPYIAVDSVLVGHVRLDDSTPAVIKASEIRQFTQPTNEPVSREDYNVPTWIDPADNLSKSYYGQVEFDRSVPAIHTGDVPKKVMIDGAEATLVRLRNVSTFTPPERSYSSTSTDTYDGPISQQTASVDDGSFDIAAMLDGVRDDVVAMKGKNCLFVHYQDEFTPQNFLVCQGIVAPSREFAAGVDATATVTIAARDESLEISG